MIKFEQQERQCGANDDVIITDFLIPRKRKFKAEVSREEQSKISYIEENDQSTTMGETDQQTLKKKQKKNTTFLNLI